MGDVKPIGLICEKENGDLVFVPVSNANTVRSPRESDEAGKIVKQPTPEDVVISKEKKADHSLTGVLKKHEVPDKEMSKQSDN